MESSHRCQTADELLLRHLFLFLLLGMILSRYQGAVGTWGMSDFKRKFAIVPHPKTTHGLERKYLVASQASVSSVLVNIRV